MEDPRINENGYHVHIKQFDGPLDLLLYLIEKAEVDIREVYISEITSEFLSYLSELDELDMEWRNIADVSYEIGFEHLEAYISEHHTTYVPLNAECKDGYRLGRWISNFKRKFKAGTL